MDLLCLEFINSRWYITHKPYADPLEDNSWIKDLFKKWDLPLNNAVSNYEYEQLKGLRKVLAEAVERLLDNEKIGAGQIKTINQYLNLSPIIYELTADGDVYGTRLKPVSSDWNYSLAQITYSFSELITKYDLNRIKQCENPSCNWIYYDDSKNNSRKWCCNTCASLIKVRNYRNKYKTAEK